MKRSHTLRSLLSAALLAAACHNPVTPEPGETTASLLLSVRIASEDPSARGSAAPDEQALNNLNVFIYDEGAGALHSSGYFTDYGHLVFDHLIEGRRYRILALGNVGKKTPPARLDSALNYAHALETPGRLSEEGIPMARSESFAFGGDGDGYLLEIGLERLLAKYHLAVDLSRMQGLITFRSANIRQAATRLKPFQEASAATVGTTANGDRLTEMELRRLAEGGGATLLVPENRQGDLLQPEGSPWEKTPEAVGERGSLCTYLEIHADYQYEGLSIDDLTYRFYLGEDTQKNFDIRRNTEYTVTLALSDTNAAVASSWKLERGTVEDARTLSFDRLSDTLLQNASLTRTLLRAPVPFGYRLQAGEGFEEAGLSVSGGEDGACLIRSSAITGHAKTGRLWAISWDGRLRSSCDITVMNWDTLITFRSTPPVMWPGETVGIQATAFFENEGSSRDITSEASWSISGSAARFCSETAGTDTVRVYGEREGAVYVRAQYRGKADSLLLFVSHPVGVGCLGADTLYTHVGDSVMVRCFVRFASGDTLHDCNELFFWRLSDINTVYAVYGETDGLFHARNPGTGSIRYRLRRDTTLQSVKYITVLP